MTLRARWGREASADPTDSSLVLYIGCLYWAVATLSTLGYGDIIPTTDVERAFTCLSALVGASIYAYMVGAVCGIVAGMNEKNTKFYQQIDNLNHFMVRATFLRDAQSLLGDSKSLLGDATPIGL